MICSKRRRVADRAKLGDKQRREIVETVVSDRKSGAEMACFNGVSEPTVARLVAAFRQQTEGALA